LSESHGNEGCPHFFLTGFSTSSGVLSEPLSFPSCKNGTAKLLLMMVMHQVAGNAINMLVIFLIHLIIYAVNAWLLIIYLPPG
jgi:hypothetical protein